MERIIEVAQTKISEIRGYMTNSGRDCASGTCDHSYKVSSDEIITEALKQVSADFYK